ncbi:MAG: 2-C-methyl-D-erythritol 4-phosphate cytidylyltransferase [Thermoflexaceae bacterium]|nr:2-C-methyl-D-erythritol 4-phosphate cytidylyltransferase [Thermoflexaceae bacterium]
MKADAVIVAAGSSTRFGEGNKLFADLCGKPVLAWTIAAYAAAALVERIVVVAQGEALSAVDAIARTEAGEKFVKTVAGGTRRRDSVEAGLRAVRARYVAIHDGARPLITAGLIDRCIAAAEGTAGAVVAIPVTDTIKEVRGGMIAGHPERAMLWAAQTPQVVLRRAWLDAAAASDDDETDDSAMLARFGLETAVVEGDPGNLKITKPLDLELAAAILRSEGRTPCG